ncbi:gamma-secretase-activating protein [Anaeramoeba flamelloides]|uniref:Gamma-secretase-activating protein n=1 Tax=Anaeramoeba flamelloides TaxID=1746091 RepID=A0AAV8AIP9_9EUKA|nr:gamma-secretase-activating protein [Anaeramoeba flamelloides]
MLNIEIFFSSKSLISSATTSPKTLRIVGIGYNGTLLIAKRVKKCETNQNQKQKQKQKQKTKKEKSQRKIIFEELYLISYFNYKTISSQKPLWASKENEIILAASLSCDQSYLIVSLSQKILFKKHKGEFPKIKRYDSFVINLKTGESSSILLANQCFTEHLAFLPISKEFLEKKKKKKEIIKNFRLLSIIKKKKIQILALKISTNSLFNKKRWKTTIKQKKELFQSHIYSQFITEQKLLWVITSDLNLYYCYLHVFKFVGNKFKLLFKISIPESFVRNCLYKKKLKISKNKNTNLAYKHSNPLSHYNSSDKIHKNKSKKDHIKNKNIITKAKSFNRGLDQYQNKKNFENECIDKGNDKKVKSSNFKAEEKIEKGNKEEVSFEEEDGKEGREKITSLPIDNNSNNNSNTHDHNNSSSSSNINNNNSMNDNNIINTYTNKSKSNINRNNKDTNDDNNSKNSKENNSHDKINKKKRKKSQKGEQKIILHKLNILNPLNNKIKNKIVSLTYHIKGYISLIKLSDTMHCLCHQENLKEKTEKSIIVTIFIIEKKETLKFKIPISNISLENFKKIRIFFTKIPKNLLLIWIPKYYFHLIDCTPEHLTCTSLRFETGSPFVSTLPNMNDDEDDDDDDDERESEKGVNNHSKKKNNFLDQPNLISIPTDHFSLFLDKRSGYVYRYLLDSQSLLSVLNSPIGPKYSKLIIHYLLSHLDSEKLDFETRTNFQNTAYHFLIFCANHNLNRNFFKEFLISAPFQLLIQQKKFKNISISKIIPSTTIKKFKNIKKKKKEANKNPNQNQKTVINTDSDNNPNPDPNVNIKSNVKTKCNRCNNDNSNNKPERLIKTKVSVDGVIGKDEKKITIGDGVNGNLCIDVNCEKNYNDDDNSNEDNNENFNYVKNLVEISKNKVNLEKRQLMKNNQFGLFSFKNIWKNYHQKQTIQMHLDKYLSGKGNTELQKQRKQINNNTKSNQDVFLEILNDKINSHWQGKRKELALKLASKYNYCRKRELHKLWSLIKSNIIESLENENEKIDNNNNNNNTLLKNLNNNMQERKDNLKKWFQILLNLSSVFEALFFDPPKDFNYYFLRVSYKSLRKTEFCCYLNQNIFEIDQEFVQELVDKKKENHTFISKCIIHLKNQKTSLNYLMENSKEKRVLLQYFSSKHYHVYQNWQTSFQCNYDNFFAPYEINFKLFNDSFSKSTVNKEKEFILQNFDAFLPKGIL